MALRPIIKTTSAYDYPLIIRHLLHTPKQIAKDVEIVYRDIRRMKYSEFFERLGRLANMLARLGVKPGSIVGVMDWDSHRYLECYFAVPMMGAVLHTINVRLSPEQILYTINHAEDEVLLVNSDFLPVVEKLKDQFQTIKHIILLQDISQPCDSSINFAGEYEDLLKDSDPEYHFEDFPENTMATLFYTTGTTGNPKGVYFSHRQIVLHTLARAAQTALKPGGNFINRADVYMPLTPMFHVHAWGFPYTATMLGIKQVYPGRYEPEMILKLIAQERVTVSHCVPTLLHMLLSHPASKDFNLSGWRVGVGGAPFPEALCKAALERGIDASSGYGMSETCPEIAHAFLQPFMLDWSLDEQVKVRTKTGIPIMLVEMKIVDPDGKELPHDGKSTGELVVRGPWFTQGYFKDPERSEELWRGGWLHTGDVGYIDQYGYLKITDRIKDVIKTGGEWVSSIELENIILKHEAVSEAAAISVSHEKWGERPVVLVVLKPDYVNKVTEEELKKFFSEFVEKGLITKWAIPDRIIFVDALPKTSVGKLDKKLMRHQVKEFLKL